MSCVQYRSHWVPRPGGGGMARRSPRAGLGPVVKCRHLRPRVGGQRPPEEAGERGVEAQDEDPPRGVALAEMARPRADRHGLARARGAAQHGAARADRLRDPLVLCAHDWIVSSSTPRREIRGAAGYSRGRPARKVISASLTSAGRSCCVQWPAPGSSTRSRRSGTFRQAIHGGAGAQDDGVAVAGDEERGHRDAGAAPGRHQLPGAVEVAVPVEAAAKARARELGRVEVDVRLAEPRGQRLGVGQALEERRALRLRPACRRRRPRCRTARAAPCSARPARARPRRRPASGSRACT